jgi:hypothetical protein
MAYAYVQLFVDPALSGHVMRLYMLISMGGAPIIGALTNHLVPRAGVAICGGRPGDRRPRHGCGKPCPRVLTALT